MNFDDKSGAMETEDDVRVWNRSETLGFRYMSFIGEEDSSALTADSTLNNGEGPYDSCTCGLEEETSCNCCY